MAMVLGMKGFDGKAGVRLRSLLVAVVCVPKDSSSAESVGSTFDVCPVSGYHFR